MTANNLSLNESNYNDLWGQFHANSLSEFDKASAGVDSDIIVWSSGLTEPDIIEKHLDKRRYIVEAWEGSFVPVELVKLGYKIIIALKDVYYLDHGFWSPTVYHNWKLIYNNRMPEVDNPNLLLGAEVRVKLQICTRLIVDIKNNVRFCFPRRACGLNMSTTMASIPEYGQEQRL